MPLEAHDGAPPPHMTLEEHQALQESTPTSFQGHLPILRMHLDNVACLLQPDSAWPSSAGEQDSSLAVNGESEHSAQQVVRVGNLYLTDSVISFTPTSTSHGAFKLDYPSLSLHAVSRSLPPALQTSRSQPSDTSCIYCQINLASSTAEDQEEDDEDSLAELWILPESQDKVEPLFEALSYSASLYPSAIDGEGGDSSAAGHPFASFGPFGTGLMNSHSRGDVIQETNGDAYEDAEEDDAEGQQGAVPIELSETGRNTLSRLDALVQWPDVDQEKGFVSSPTASFHSSDPRKETMADETKNQLTSITSSGPTNTLILVGLPQEVFQHPPLAAALLDLLHAYGDLHSWTPLASFGRAIITYEQETGAQRAKEALDRLLLPLLDDGEEEDPQSISEAVVRKQEGRHTDGVALRAYYGDTQALARLRDSDEADHLPVPTTDRNFLISPPGSPPVGWEPIREDPPNTNTLADDLIRALGSLRDRGLGVAGHTPVALSSNEQASKSSLSPSNAAIPAPSLLIPPRRAAVRSQHPLAHEAYKVDEEDIDGQPGVSLPGVTVQNVDAEQDAQMQQSEGLDQRLNKNLSISSVKATVESMRGPTTRWTDEDQTEQQSMLGKITPTARPPL